MARCLFVLLLAALSVCLAGCAAFRPKAPLPLEQVVEMSRREVPPDQIIDRIRASETTFAVRGAQFATLRDAGVSPLVLDEIQRAYIGVLSQHLRACGRCQPRPVSLDFLKLAR